MKRGVVRNKMASKPDHHQLNSYIQHGLHPFGKARAREMHFRLTH